jgi:hypothetical protein
MFLKGVLLNNLYRNINVKPGHFTGNFSEAYLLTIGITLFQGNNKFVDINFI